jgi:hypothetical protein
VDLFDLGEAMIHAISSKFEINLQSSNASDVPGVGTFVVQNRIPALVVNPELFVAALTDRQVKMRQCKFIVAIDFRDNGKHYAMDKIKQLPGEVLGADGFDVMVTPGKNEKEIGKEMGAVGSFLRQVNPAAEIRWVMGCRRQSTENIIAMLKMAKEYPPTFIRTDGNLKVPDLDVRGHKVDIALVRKHIGTAIKISGNVDWATVKEVKNQVARFDVTVAQARSIIKAANDEADQEREEKANAGIFDPEKA